MRQQIKKYLSILFLFFFLFPMVEMDMHAFEHQNDIHCNATDKHFHTLEHSCSLCDFTITDSSYPTENEHQFITSIQSFLFQPFIESVNTPSAFQNLPSRAPPVI